MRGVDILSGICDKTLQNGQYRLWLGRVVGASRLPTYEADRDLPIDPIYFFDVRVGHYLVELRANPGQFLY